MDPDLPPRAGAEGAGTAPPNDAASPDGRAAKPFGFIGLCFSLAGIIVLGAVLTVLIAGLVLGWHAMIETVGQAGATLGQSSGPGLRRLYVILIAAYLGVGLAVFLAALWRGRSRWRDLVAWRSFRLFDKTIWAIMLAALVYSVIADNVLARFLPHPAMGLKVPADPVAAGLLFVLAVLAGPLTEELVFRGWIYTSLRFSWGMWPALLISSVVFALAHDEKTHFYALAVFPIGFALGVIRERTGSLKASIFFHALNNFIAFWLATLK